MSDLLTQIDEIIDAPDTAPRQDALEQVTELLSGPEGGKTEESAGDSETEEEAQEEAAADEDQSGVDYSAEIPMSDGSKVTLGALKDAYQDSQRNVLALQERENALMSKYAEVNELSRYAQLPPDKLAAIQQQQREYLEQQHAQMLQAMPQFNDQAVFTKAKEGIMQLAGEYGVTDIVAGVSDHRVVKLLNDFVQLRSSIKAAKDSVKPLRASEPKARTAPAGKPDVAQQAAQRAKQSGSMSDQVRAINALLQ